MYANFDAFEFGESITMYPDSIKTLLNRGGSIAWGIVTTSPVISEQTVESLTEQLEKTMDALVAQGIDKQQLIEQALITPSCGTGSMQPDDAEKVFTMTRKLSEHLRTKYGL